MIGVKGDISIISFSKYAFYVTKTFRKIHVKLGRMEVSVSSNCCKALLANTPRNATRAIIKFYSGPHGFLCGVRNHVCNFYYRAQTS